VERELCPSAAWDASHYQYPSELEDMPLKEYFTHNWYLYMEGEKTPPGFTDYAKNMVVKWKKKQNVKREMREQTIMGDILHRKRLPSMQRTFIMEG
jgi:hypothetical protein